MPTPLVDAAPQALGIRDEEVVADELHAVAELACQRRPRLPVVLGGTVLDRDDRVALDAARPELGSSPRRAARVPSKRYAPSRVDLARRRIERDRDALAVARALGGLEDRLDRRLARRQVGREAALVADAGREPRSCSTAAARGRPRRRSAAPPRTSRAPAGTTMNSCRSIEFCGVRAAVDHVQHRHGQRHRRLAAEVAEERDARRRPPAPSRPRARRRGSRSRRAGPCSACRRARSARRRAPPGRARRARAPRRASSPFTFATAMRTPLPPQSASPSRSSTASWTPVEAPEGTAARPSAPDSSRTSTSTVGLPRESRTVRP